MAQIKDFITATPLAANELVPISQNGNTRKATVADIRGVVNDVTTGGIDKALSAEQGKILASQMSEKANDTDSNRTTTNKTVTGAINELNSNKVNKTSIVNNSTTTQEGFALDARQGKALADATPMLYKTFPTFTNGTATITIAGVTPSSTAMFQWNHGGNVYPTSVVCGWGGIITITVNDANVNGTVNGILLLKI